MSDALYPHAWGRFGQQFHACLADTLYAPTNAGMSLDGGTNTLTVFSMVEDVPQLRLGPAYQISAEPLKGLDDQSRQILAQHGC